MSCWGVSDEPIRTQHPVFGSRPNTAYRCREACRLARCNWHSARMRKPRNHQPIKKAVPEGLQLLTPREAADSLRVSLTTLQGYVVDGDLHYINVSRGKKRARRRFSMLDIERFKEDRKTRVSSCPSIEIARPIGVARGRR